MAFLILKDERRLSRGEIQAKIEFAVDMISGDTTQDQALTALRSLAQAVQAMFEHYEGHVHKYEDPARDPYNCFGVKLETDGPE